jgi:epoxyqueuosine reductase
MRCEQGRLREKLGLSPDPVHQMLVDFALRAGFSRAAIVDPRLLTLPARRAQRRSGEPESGLLAGVEWPWVTEPSGWSRSSTILICCLSCLRTEPDDLGTPGDPHALVAPFARAHYYRTAISLLRVVASRFESEAGIPRGKVRLFSNSRIPEKPLLVASGLAAYGRNGVALVPGLGSLFVIAGAVFPVRTEWEDIPPAVPQRDPCGACQRCRTACPAGAIDVPYVVRKELCLQGMAGSAAPLAHQAMRMWGARLYGCHDCQAACPHNRGLMEVAVPAAGEIGPSISLRAFLSEDSAERKKRFRGTALGMSWVPGEALLRNALVAAGNRGDASVRAQVERHLADSTDVVRGAARWALDRL